MVCSMGVAIGADGPVDTQVSYTGKAGVKRDMVPMGLADCIFTALQNNRDLETSYLDRIVEKFELKIAEDEFAVDINVTPALSYSVFRVNNDRTDTRRGDVDVEILQRLRTGGEFRFLWNNSGREPFDSADANKYATSSSVNFSQPLLRGAGVEIATADLRIARIDEDIRILTLKSTVMDTVFSVIEAYREFMQAKRQLEISRGSLERSKEQMTINNALVETGRMASQELIQTQSDIADQEVDVLSSENAFDAARLELLQVMDIDKNTMIDPIEKVQAVPVVLDYQQSLSLAFQNRPDYLQSRLDREIARIDLKVAENERLWDLSFDTSFSLFGDDVSYGRAFENGIHLDNTDWFAGLILEIPLYGDLSRKETMINAEVALKQAEIALIELTESIEIEVLDALRNIEIQWKQVKLAAMARRLSEQKLDIEKEKLKTGRSSNFQVVSFQNDLVAAQSDELDAIIAYANSLSAFDQTLGTTLETWKIRIKDGERAEQP